MRENLMHGSTGRRWRRASLRRSGLRTDRKRSGSLARLPHHGVPRQRLTLQIVFSVIGRKVISPADFADLGALATGLVSFEPRYNATARPFDWTFTRGDLAELVRRIEAHQFSATAVLAA